MAEASGKIVATARIQQSLSLHTTDRNAFRTRLFTLLKRLCEAAGIKTSGLENAVVCMGITGTTFPYDSTCDLPREIEQIELKIGRLICKGDAEIAFRSHLPGQFGGAIICHLGSAAYACLRKGDYRFGGWGPLIGDSGSGYWMGARTLTVLATNSDQGKNRDGILWQKVLSWLRRPTNSAGAKFDFFASQAAAWNKIEEAFNHDQKLKLETALFSYAHKVDREFGQEGWRKLCAGLVIPLIQAAEAGDKDANGVVDDAVKSLAYQYTELFRSQQEEFTNNKTLLYGGVITGNPFFEKKLTQRLANLGFTEDTIVVGTKRDHMRPVLGALLFALNDVPGTDAAAISLTKHIGAQADSYQDLINS